MISFDANSFGLNFRTTLTILLNVDEQNSQEQFLSSKDFNLVTLNTYMINLQVDTYYFSSLPCFSSFNKELVTND